MPELKQLQEAIKNLEADIKHDEQDIALAEEHPTDTKMFRNALANHKERLQSKIDKLIELKKELDLCQK